MDIYSLGEMVIDFTPGADAGSYVRNAGGAPANFAIAATRLGCSAGFCGKMGNDDFGRFLQETLRREGVAVLCEELTDSAITTMAFVTLHQGGERTFTFARKPGADMLLNVSDVLDEQLIKAAIVHAGSCSLSAQTARDATKHALKRGAELGKLVSFDVNYRPLLWEGDEAQAICQIREILPYVDLLKVSDEEIFMLGGEGAIQKIMADNSIALCALTGGSGTTKVFWDRQVFTSPAKAVKAIDATGAGDAFWGAFIAHLINTGVKDVKSIKSETVRAALDRAMLAGSIAVGRYGAIASLPYKDEIEPQGDMIK